MSSNITLKNIAVLHDELIRILDEMNAILAGNEFQDKKELFLELKNRYFLIRKRISVLLKTKTAA